MPACMPATGCGSAPARRYRSMVPRLLLSPAVGAALMSLSTVIVAVNAKLLARFEPADR